MDQSYTLEEAVGDREMSYSEYMERMEKQGQRGNAVNGLWKDLVEHFLFFGGMPRSAESTLRERTLPVSSILGLLPEQLKDLQGMGPARTTVYSALYRSLRANPHPIERQDPSHDLTVEGLQAYASPRYSKGTITSAWSKFHRDEGIGLGSLSFAQLEAFCVKLRSKNPPPGFKGEAGALLLGWYEYLKGAR